MPNVNGNASEKIILDAGSTLTVSAATIYTSGLVREISNGGKNLPGNRITNIPSISSKVFGPFPTVRVFSIEATGSGGVLDYQIDVAPYANATQVGNIEGFTGSFALKNEDMGKVFRCDDASNVTITVPNSLVQGFNCGFIQYAAGNIALAFETGATNKSGKTTMSIELGRGSLLVAKQSDMTDAAEIVVGGDFN